MQNDFSLAVLEHQKLNRLGGSEENPEGSLLHELPERVEALGKVSAPKAPWCVHRLDGCQLGVKYPGRDENYGMPHLRGQVWWANFPLDTMTLTCKNVCVRSPLKVTEQLLTLHGETTNCWPPTE